MSISKTKTYNQDIKRCFDLTKQVLEKAGCKIVRIRDFAWLIQASKTINDRDYLINVTLKSSPATQVIVSCLGPGETPSEIELDLANSIFTILEEQLNGG